MPHRPPARERCQVPRWFFLHVSPDPDQRLGGQNDLFAGAKKEEVSAFSKHQSAPLKPKEDSVRAWFGPQGLGQLGGSSPCAQTQPRGCGDPRPRPLPAIPGNGPAHKPTLPECRCHVSACAVLLERPAQCRSCTLWPEDASLGGLTPSHSIALGTFSVLPHVLDVRLSFAEQTFPGTKLLCICLSPSDTGTVRAGPGWNSCHHS